MKSTPGRPRILADDAVITVNTEKTKSKLQMASERRAIVNKVIDAGGTITVKRLDDEFGYSVRAKVLSLISAGWLVARSKK